MMMKTEPPLLVPVVAAGAPKACALHKLRWGSDPRIKQQRIDEEAAHARNTAKQQKRAAAAAAAAAGGTAEEGQLLEGDLLAMAPPSPPPTPPGGVHRVVAGSGGGSSSSANKPPGSPGRKPVSFMVFGASSLPGRDAALYGAKLSMSKSDSVASEISEGTGWGHYEDCELKDNDSACRLDSSRPQNRETPEYVLEDSLASQALWHTTAGTRPAQPAAERKKFEQMWAQNFTESKVDYDRAMAQEQNFERRLFERLRCNFVGSFGSLREGDEDGEDDDDGEDGERHGRKQRSRSESSTSSSGSLTTVVRSSAERARLLQERLLARKEKRIELLLREQSPFGTSVTKSWQCECCGELTSIMIRIPKYQIVRTGEHDVHAEYLVVCRLGAVTFGLWRRYSHFRRLADAIATGENAEDYQNTLWSWRCLRRRQRWFRCLEKDYLALKCFLLERFLHDAVFESSSSTLFTDFLDIKI